MTFRFGKFYGKKIADVPVWYLTWLADQDWFAERFPQMAAAVSRRLDALADNQTNDETSTTAITTDVLKSWRRSMLAKWHPDKPGGSHPAFLAASDCVESLSRLLTERGVSA